MLNILSLATSLGHTVWCVDTTDVFHNGFSSDTFQEALCSKKNHLLFAAVVFGGYVVDRTWLERVKDLQDADIQVPEPHWRLRGALRQPLELFVHESFKEEWGEFSKIIQETQTGRWVSAPQMAHGSLLSTWTIRKSWKEIRQAKKGLVLCGSQEKANEVQKTKQKREDKVKKLEEEVQELKAKWVAGNEEGDAGKKREMQKTKLKEEKIKWEMQKTKLKEARAARQNGTPIGPQKFFSEIAGKVQLRK